MKNIKIKPTAEILNTMPYDRLVSIAEKMGIRTQWDKDVIINRLIKSDDIRVFIDINKIWTPWGAY